MKKCFIFSMSIIVTALIIGCSNQSPVSVTNASTTPAEQAYVIGSGVYTDVSGSGGCIYGVNANDPATSNDFYIYRWNNPTASWVKTSHWGRGVAVSQTGRCFHFNSYNDVWVCRWRNESDSSGFVATAPGGRTIKDIAAGSNGTASYDYIWIICTDQTCWRCEVQSGQLATAWQAYSLGSYTYANSITAQPTNGTNVFIGTNAGVAKFDGYSFPLLSGNGLPSNSIADVGVYGNTIFYEPSGGCLYMKDITTSDAPTLLTCDTRSPGLSADGLIYYYVDYLYRVNYVLH